MKDTEELDNEGMAQHCHPHGHEHHHEHEHEDKHCHDPHHGHHHHHHHHAAPRGRKLLWATILNFSITLVQIVGGIVSNSLSLLSDAIHNLGDSSAIFIAFLAGRRAEKKPDERRTFGYKRIEIIAALFNAVVLIAICLFLFVEAYHRFVHPEPIHGLVMLIVALFGLIANLLSVVILHKDKDHNLNIRAAYMHLLGDTLSSVAVIIGGVAIWIWEIYWLDPAITILVGIYIIWHTWGIVAETTDILMQSSPKGVVLSELKSATEAMEGVENIHHVHIWNMDEEHIHLEAHVNIDHDMPLSEAQTIREAIERMMHDRFGIHHVTIQLEHNACRDHDELIHHSHE